ncbi:hypothetical protein [Micromonospora sp. NPDC002575]
MAGRSAARGRAHRDLRERLDLAPDEITQRLNRLLARCHYDTTDVDI